METQHVGVVRLHEIASENRQLTPSELEHLDACEACMKVLCVISRALKPEEKLRQFARELTQETASNP